MRQMKSHLRKTAIGWRVGIDNFRKKFIPSPRKSEEGDKIYLC
jgi:hypothetical protein